LLPPHRGIPKTTSLPHQSHQRALTLRRGRRSEGSKERGQREDEVRRSRDKDDDFQHRDSSIRRSGRRKGFLWAGSCSRWRSASRDLSKKPRKHLTFASSSSEDEKTDEDRSTLLRSKPSDPKSSARRKRSSTRRYKVDSVRRERRTNREKSRRSHRTKPESTTASGDEHDTKTTAVTRPKCILKPPKFDGTTSFETFWAQFQNCVRHNRWDRSTELVYLRN